MPNCLALLDSMQGPRLALPLEGGGQAWTCWGKHPVPLITLECRDMVPAFAGAHTKQATAGGGDVRSVRVLICISEQRSRKNIQGTKLPHTQAHLTCSFSSQLPLTRRPCRPHTPACWLWWHPPVTVQSQCGPAGRTTSNAAQTASTAG